MAARKVAKLQPNQGQEKAIRRMEESVLIHDHSKEKARYTLPFQFGLSTITELKIVGNRKTVRKNALGAKVISQESILRQFQNLGKSAPQSCYMDMRQKCSFNTQSSDQFIVITYNLILVLLQKSLETNFNSVLIYFYFYQISDELRQILTSIPRVRTNEGLKKVRVVMLFFCPRFSSVCFPTHVYPGFLSQVQRLCRSTRAFMIFPLEREADLSRLVGYERYVFSDCCPKDPSDTENCRYVPKLSTRARIVGGSTVNSFACLFLFQIRQRPSTCLPREGTREVLLRVIWKR